MEGSSGDGGGRSRKRRRGAGPAAGAAAIGSVGRAARAARKPSRQFSRALSVFTRAVPAAHAPRPGAAPVPLQSFEPGGSSWPTWTASAPIKLRLLIHHTRILQLLRTQNAISLSAVPVPLMSAAAPRRRSPRRRSAARLHSAAARLHSAAAAWARMMIVDHYDASTCLWSLDRRRVQGRIQGRLELQGPSWSGYRVRPGARFSSQVL